MECKEIQALMQERLLQGADPLWTHGEMRQHLADCAECRGVHDRLLAIRGYYKAPLPVDELGQHKLLAARRRMFTPTSALAAAAVVLLVLLSTLFYFYLQPQAITNGTEQEFYSLFSGKNENFLESGWDTMSDKEFAALLQQAEQEFSSQNGEAVP